MYDCISKIHILGLNCWSWYYCVLFPVVHDTDVTFSLILGHIIGELFYLNYLHIVHKEG